MKRNLYKNLAFLFLMLLCMVAMVGCTTKIEPDPHYIITYFSGVGGCVSGDNVQTIEKDSDGTLVTAEPHDGYLFSGWSDGVIGLSRKEKNEDNTLVTAVSYPVKLSGDYSNNMGRIVRSYEKGSRVNVTANFVSKIKKLTYQYNDATENNTVEDVTLFYEKIGEVSFAIPQKENCIFDGWYLDPEFTVKVTDGNGVYYNGRSIFFSHLDTLYAKWITEETNNYKILLVFAEEAYASLKTVDGNLVDVNYKMALTERKICEYIPSEISKYLNEWLDGIVNVEIDTYFTIIPLGKDSFGTGMSYEGTLDYSVFAKDVPEVMPILKNYRSVTVTSNKNDYQKLLHCSSGSANKKYASVNMESLFYPLLINNEAIERLKPTYEYWSDEILQVYIHEFVHTVEVEVGAYEYHEVLKQYHLKSHLVIAKQYLLNESYIDGKKEGIPLGYWLGNCNVSINFITQAIDFKSAGKVVLVGDTEENNEIRQGVYMDIPYGSSITVEAIPYEGYKFSHWTDGITTARRTDTNVISSLTAKAIFVNENG